MRHLFFAILFFSLSSLSWQEKVVVTGLDRPWAVVAGPDGNIWITEKRKGSIRIYDSKFVLQKTLPGTSLPGFAPYVEAGLLDLAFHPQFSKNNWLYVAYSVHDRQGYRIQLNRFTYKEGQLQERQMIFNGPGGESGHHFGCRLLFDAEGFLLATFGERTEKEKSQDLNQMNGKIVRLTDTGEIPRHNPYGTTSPVYSQGHRNPQGLALHPMTQKIYDSEHGPSTFDAPAGGDEINEIRPGVNYGWPVAHHRMQVKNMQAPLLEFTPAVAPSGMAFYTGDLLANWKHDLFIATLKGQSLLRVRLSPTSQIVETEKLLVGKYGRLRDVETAPGGGLLVLAEAGQLIHIR